MSDSSTLVDQYLANIPSGDARESLGQLRTIVRDEVPEAEECISYGMPCYKLNGYLCGFAAFKNHCSFFPGTALAEFAEQLKGYKTSTGTIQFSPDQPLPEDLVRSILRVRVAMNAEKAGRKK